MRLLVVRHAIAMDRVEYQLAARSTQISESDVSDDLRPLTLEGVRKMKKSARGLARAVERPVFLVSSPLVRALQTAEVLQTVWDGLECQICEDLRPDSKPQALATWINGRIESLEDDPLVSVIGHEPHLSMLVSWLLGGSAKHFVELKKGGACLIEFPHGIEKARGVLKWLATPQFLRALK